MIPYVEQPSVHLGPFTVHAFGLIVAVSVLVGLQMVGRRFQRAELDPVVGERLVWWMLLGGFVGAHLFSVLFYFPTRLVADPLLLVRVWEDVSSFGGMLGGGAGFWLYFRVKGRRLDAGTHCQYLDAVAFVFPFALAVGRIACSLAHDHPGGVTDFPLGISLHSDAARAFITDVYQAAGRVAELPAAASLVGLAFHDLGWYELLFLAGVVVPAFVLLDRKPRPSGFFVVAFVVLYMPARFALDFLRVADVRYSGLTPAQWAGAALLVTVAVGIAPRLREKAHSSAG